MVATRPPIHLPPLDEFSYCRRSAGDFLVPENGGDGWIPRDRSLTRSHHHVARGERDGFSPPAGLIRGRSTSWTALETMRRDRRPAVRKHPVTRIDGPAGLTKKVRLCSGSVIPANETAYCAAAAFAWARSFQSARSVFISARSAIMRAGTPLYFFTVPLTLRSTAPWLTRPCSFS